MERNETKEKTIRYEEKVFDILMKSKDRLPPWIKGFYITKPNSKLDREGADIVVQTSDVGDHLCNDELSNGACRVPYRADRRL